MIGVRAQVSLYPLPQAAVAPGICKVLEEFEGCATVVEPDAASSLLVGDDATIFAALQEAFCQAAKQGKVVMVVTLSNACPTPGAPNGGSP
ncbi:MAG: YkoF family thiamine/hydroxymethylpyrimidine-binding protein [Anaerolineae bacterium]|jgi:hypothetical protein